ncbi:MAG: UvrD-helicase domain-containing protein [Terriglobales bacterium]
MSTFAPAPQLQAEDDHARQRALDPGVSAIVEAPAGAGKTELLIQRYLRLLAEVEEPERILALTFTRKAAAEMRRRVAAALLLARQPQPSQEPERGRWQLARAALRRDQERGWQLVENPARVRALTFDSFCRSVVERTPWLSRLGSLPAQVDEAKAVVARAARELLAGDLGDSSRAALRTVLDHLDNDWPKTERLVAALLACRDQWMRYLFAGPAGEPGWRAALEAGLAGAIRARLGPLRDAFAAAGLAADLAIVVSTADPPGAAPEDLGAWQRAADLLLTKAGTPRKIAPADAKPVKQQWSALVAALDDRLASALHQVRALPPPRYEDAQWQVLAALIVVLQRAAAQLKTTFAAAGVVDFIEVAQAARAAFGDDENPTDLAYALDGQLVHLLVDEFQDTSVAQHDLLLRLTREWSPGDGRTVFLVGDPKQSIYRFRQAEVALFLRVQAHGLGHLPLAPLRLRRNFRSQPRLIAWVNQAGSAIFPARADEASRAVPFESAVPGGAEAQDPGSVQVHLSPARDDESEASCVFELIAAARRRDPLGKIAVLVRAKSHVAAILARLRAAGVPVRAVDMEKLGARAVVLDLWALTRALAHPADRMAWLALLRAPWCGLSLADLHALVAGAEDGARVWTLLQDPACLARLSAAGRPAVLRLRQILAAALAERERRSWRRAVEGVWIALGGPACLPSAAAYADAQAYLALLETLEAEGAGGDLDELAARLQELDAAPHDSDPAAVQIMTIHKAKGLEFDTVILPGLGRRPQSGRQPLLRWDEVIEDGQPRLLLAPIAAAGGEDKIGKYLASLEHDRDSEEMKRLLYVAVTRAKRELHLLGAVASADRRTLLGALKPVLEAPWAEAEANKADAKTALNAMPPAPEAPLDPQRFSRLAAGWQLPAPPPPVPLNAPLAAVAAAPVTFAWAGGPRRQIGNVLHACLCQMARRPGTLAAAAAIRAALRQEGLAGAALDAAVAQVGQALAAVLADDRGRWILAPHEHEASEQDLAGWTDDGYIHARVDRSFIAEGVRWIIDYKTGVHEGGDIEAFLRSERSRYQDQLERYARLYRAQDERPLRLALFFPLVRRADGRLAFEDWSATPAAAVR